MASFTLERPQVFPDGTDVLVYPASNWPDGHPSGAPRGNSVAEKTVAGGKAEFSGLSEGIAYAATAEVGGVRRYVAFVIPTTSGESPTFYVQKDEPTGAADGAVWIEA